MRAAYRKLVNSVDGHWYRPSRLRDRLLHYGIAVGSVGTALMLTLALRPILGPTPTPLFFAAIMISAWYGGLGPGLAATILSTLGLNYFFIPPIDSLDIRSWGILVRLGVFVAAAGLISSLNESRRAAQYRAEMNLQQLRDSEARFGRLAEANIIGVIVAHINGAILEANDVFLQMVGYTRHELRAGQVRWREMTPPEFLDVSEQAIHQLLTTGVCAPFEKEYICKDGSRLPILYGAAMNGDVLIGFVLDLSDRKHLEQTLQQRQQEFLTLIENLPDVIFRLDRELRHLYISPSIKLATGISDQEFLGKTGREIGLPDELCDRFDATCHDAIATGRLSQMEFSLAGRSYQSRIIPEFDAEGNVASLMGITEDISDRKQAEEALRQSEERYRYLAETIPQLIWTANSAGILLDVNQRWLDFTGLTLEQVQLEGWSVVVHPEDVSALTDQWQMAQRTGQHYQAEGRMRRVDGVYRWHLHQAVPMTDDRGAVIKWFGTATDIEDQKRLEQQRDLILQQEQAARADAEQANRIKDEFLAVLSHELRSPLNPILGWSRLLQTQTLDADKTAYALTTIERNAKLQAELITDLLDVSRILRGKLNLTICPVDLGSTIQAALETVRLAAEAKSIQIDTRLDPNVSKISGDPSRLQQVVWNLLSNAVKFTPEGGRVEVRLESVDGGSRDLGHVQITVTDTGKGIDPHFLPHVFDYFRQADASTTRQFGGLGLGLAIVRHLVELHGGTVRASSAGEGQGATFIVTLPLNLHHPESPTVAQPPPVSTDLTGVTLLVIDDEMDAREFCTFFLEQQGATVTAVASAQEALVALAHTQPDLIISDIGMPTIDGLMLIQKIRQLPPDQGGTIPAIALTAYAGDTDYQQTRAAGFQNHIAKPVEPNELLTAIITLTAKTQ